MWAGWLQAMIRRMAVKDVFAVNAYFCIDDVTRHGFLIDPGAQAGRIIRVIEDNGWHIDRILLTHGHFDHTGAVSEICQRLGTPYSIHRDGAIYLRDTRWNLSAYCGRNVVLPDADFFVGGETFSAGSMRLRVMHTPGHTPDSVCFVSDSDGVAFVGDTIFRGSPGSTQYMGGNEVDLYNSIYQKILRLPDETTLLSGHSEPTTVGQEKGMYCDI